MTTHTDLIARLRGPTAHLVTERAANALESLEQQVAGQQAQMYADRRQALVWRDQVAALTKERNDLLILLDNWKTSQGVTEDQLAAAQAREAKLRKALEAVGRNNISLQSLAIINKALAIPADDSALMERLKEERENIADAMWQAYLDGEESYSKLHDVIRSMK